MEPILKPLKEDLLSLYNLNHVESARKLNEDLNLSIIYERFCENCQPMYFTGKFDAKTVFVMLNPGYHDEEYSFLEKRDSAFKDFDDFVSKYLNFHINYGIEKYGSDKKGKIDNFDLKQAAFLQKFENSGMNIPESFLWDKNLNIRLKAQEVVMMEKLQLEFVPYPSSKFKNLFGNRKQALNYIEFFKNDIKRLFDSIILYDRQYVIFGAKQFYFLFQAYNELGLGHIEFGEVKSFKIDNLHKKVFFNTLKILHNGKHFKAGIAHSFPRQDLPNAFDRMSKYGEFCYQEFGL